ncbi:MAG: glycosyl hydrolase 115 family protein [Alistipes sp.]|nr:glycosyl hydrolase 115 family protein [Alistipes sp.]
MKHKSAFALLVLVAVAMTACTPSGFIIQADKPATILCSEGEEAVVGTALDLLCRDMERVFSCRPTLTQAHDEASILVGTLGKSAVIESSGVDLSALEGQHEAFLLAVTPDNRLLIAGSDKRGTAYGIMELSRLIGVSPWEWWADATPQKRSRFLLPHDYRNTQAPAVAYRGIFLNDEDWGLTPWSWQNHEPSDVAGQIGPKTHERIFELLLRLRANTFWPAMHECTVPFYFTPGNQEVADRFGIFIGTSHCEPMMRNTNGEWRRDGVGDYDYVNNSSQVRAFWEQRIKEVAGSENLYTLGMRGVHDGAMQGAKTIEEQKAVLTRVLKEQRELLAHYVNEDVTQIPQVFIPYKEVLDIYHAGLEVPDEVTLMWCDDNYGYIRHLPTAEERARKGGNGIYYHISYWGRPHDYLWLGTAHPSLIYHEMMKAYERGIQKMWVLNVGDIKPSEYQIELFLDMAWNPQLVKEQGVVAHQRAFLEREFGSKIAKRLMPVMQEFYRLAYIRKPEFLGNTRTEERDPKFKIVSDLPWSEEEIRERLAAYDALSEQVERAEKAVAQERKTSYFQLVKYPVLAATQMNHKLLTAQLARHGKADWAESDCAYDRIDSLTRLYNTPKWQGIMDFRPRRLPVFDRVKRDTATEELPQKRETLHVWNGADYIEGSPTLCEGLGYAGKAVAVAKGQTIAFELSTLQTDSVEVEVRLLPNHPIDEQLRITLALDGLTTDPIAYETRGRSEEWKVNVLTNQAIRRVVLPVKQQQSHRLTFTALDEGVVLDQIYLYTPRTE